MPLATLVGRIHAHISPVRGYASGGERIPDLDGDDLVALEGYVEQVGWENLPSMQPKQVDRTGAKCLIRVLQGTVIQLVLSEDNESDTSSVGTTGSRQPRNRSERDPLGLTQGDSELEEGECLASPHEAMDHEEVLEHNTRLEEGSASEAGLAFGQTTDSQSKAMDVAGIGSESEGFSGQPMETQDARHSRGNLGSTWGDEESETAKRHRKYPKVRPYAVPVHQEIDSGWYREEDLIDPNDVAPPARRVGLPNGFWAWLLLW